MAPAGAARSRSRRRRPATACARSSARRSPTANCSTPVAVAFAQGFHTVKLYFMIGLPTEEHADVAGIAPAGPQDARNRPPPRRRPGQGAGRGVHVRAQGAQPRSSGSPRPTWEQIEEKQAFLRSQLTDRAIKFNWNNPLNSVIEALLSLGDRRVGLAVENAWRLGARLDAWDEHFDPGCGVAAAPMPGSTWTGTSCANATTTNCSPGNTSGVHTPKWVLRWERDRALASARGENARIPSAAYRPK